MKHTHRLLLGLVLLFAGLMGGSRPPAAQAYITRPVQTLGQLCAWSTYVTEVKVDKVSKEKGVVIYRKVRDLKGKYPRDTIRHCFDLKNTPRHKGSGDVPVRPDETDWKYALQWAEPGKTAIVVSLKYDPFGDFGHTYIDGLWYATMCPQRDWDFWYSIYSDPALLSRWHCGSTAELAVGLEQILAGKVAVLPVMVSGTRQDLRAGKAKTHGLKVALNIQDYNAKRDLVGGGPELTIPSLIEALQKGDKDARIRAADSLGERGPAAKAAIAVLAQVVGNDISGTVRMRAADALAKLGPDATSAAPALKAALSDARMAGRPEVLKKISEVYDKLK